MLTLCKHFTESFSFIHVRLGEDCGKNMSVYSMFYTENVKSEYNSIKKHLETNPDLLHSCY